jgi:S-adenosylmethionine:tRNA ribosyltransferase-isomerase
LKAKELDYELPFHLAAREPPEVNGRSRDSSRLLVMKRKTQEIEHSYFYDVGNYLCTGDLLVLNDTRCINSVLPGKLETGGKIEVLLCTPKDNDTWNCQLLPDGINARVGQTIDFGDGELRAKIVDKSSEFDWLFVIRFSPVNDFEAKCNKIGRPVLSPYISKIWDVKYYNTVYAKKFGSAEMPAAGRHFTNELLEKLARQGIQHVFVTLHTGLSSISVKEENFEDHKMYEEPYEITEDTANIINKVKNSGGKIVAVGTTVTRVLETVANNKGKVKPEKGYTRLYIYPGYKWKIVDALITNFHPPRSSRIALAAAFTGKDLLMRGYKEAIERGYKFYEFGDTTLTI